MPVFDRGFLFGDSVYETVGTNRGRLVFLDDHLDRLARSAQRIYLRLPPRDEIVRAVRDTLAAAENPESRVRIMVTRGDGTVDLDPASAGQPRLVVIVQPLGGPSPELYEKGVEVEIVSVTRNSPRAIDPAVKSGNYLNNVLAMGEARRRRPSAHEAILCAANGSVAEGATSNVFTVVGGQIRTPALEVGILDGVTRGKILALARTNSITCHEVLFMSQDDLRQADEVFLTSSVRSLLPVTRVDGRVLGDGEPGAVTRRLMVLYRQLVEAQT
ncbi:MAG TPA: aminotransferase class IV [Polyangia bacterium]|nr:aminotransferase class IV [Polyangia bacterium]